MVKESECKQLIKDALILYPGLSILSLCKLPDQGKLFSACASSFPAFGSIREIIWNLHSLHRVAEHTPYIGDLGRVVRGPTR